VPGCTIREWGKGVITELLEFFRCKFLVFGAFALAAERLFLSVCLGAAVSEPSELLLRPVGTKEKSDLWGREESPFGGTLWMRKTPELSGLLSRIFVTIPRSANGIANR
jgi:hypothetical protein